MTEFTYTKLPDLFYTPQTAQSVPNPAIVVKNAPLVKALGLAQGNTPISLNAEWLSGNSMPQAWPHMPIAQAYAGHQFGHFTQLGDGRALLLAEHVTPEGQRVDIQLKGSGPTPYSRGGDGRATLPAMLREYIISEAMAALGIPTTRSLAVVTTGEAIQRDVLLPGAILTRVAASHIRVGTFQFAYAFGETADLKALADYAIQRHYPQCMDVRGDEGAMYMAFLNAVMRRQAELIAQWQSVGFIHGVMNTDNMSIAGETIDYGPCAFMDEYDPNQVFSSIDRRGRYAYSNQPAMALWNLCRLAETLLPLMGTSAEEAKHQCTEILEGFDAVYQACWIKRMGAKLGLANPQSTDVSLIKDWLGLLAQHRTDFTNSFRQLSQWAEDAADTPASGADPLQCILTTDAGRAWLQRWHTRLAGQGESMARASERMNATNPWVIPRNHRVESALNAASQRGDVTSVESLLKVLLTPYLHQPEESAYTLLPADAERVTQTFCGT